MDNLFCSVLSWDVNWINYPNVPLSIMTRSISITLRVFKTRVSRLEALENFAGGKLASKRIVMSSLPNPEKLYYCLAEMHVMLLFSSVFLYSVLWGNKKNKKRQKAFLRNWGLNNNNTNTAAVHSSSFSFFDEFWLCFWFQSDSHSQHTALATLGGKYVVRTIFDSTLKRKKEALARKVNDWERRRKLDGGGGATKKE